MSYITWRRFLTGILLMGLMGSTSWGYFFDYGAGVRPAGLGRAFVAVADDVNTVNWNPAGLAYMRRYEVTTMYASLFTGFEGRLYSGVRDSLGYNYVAASVPVDPLVGYFGASWSQFNSAFYHENTFNIAYARTLTIETETFHVGSNLKFLNWNVPANDYTEALSKTGVTADLAVLYPLPRQFVAGLCWENLIPTDVGVTTYEEVPQNLRVGLSWSQDLKPLKTPLDSVLLSTEWANRSYAQNTNTFRCGVESWFFQGLAGARLGLNSTEFTVGMSGRYAFPQLNMTQLQLDYAFALPFYVEKTYGTHRVSLTASWGQQQVPELPTKVIVLPSKPPTLEITAEENLANVREQELAAARAQEESKLKEMLGKLQLDIERARNEVNRIQELIKLGQLPAIQFQENKAVLLKTCYVTVDRLGSVLEQYPNVKIRVEGYVESQGRPKTSLKLSQARAEAVRDYLKTRFKIQPDNIIPVGFGDTRPLGSNSTKEGRQANRRIEVKVLVPSGFEMSTPTGTSEAGAEVSKTEPVKPEDIVRYDDLEKQKAKVKVYEMQLNSKDVEEMFNQQHRQKEGKPTTP